MSTPSSRSGAGSQAPEGPRDLRDRWQFRVGAILVVLVVAVLFAKGCGSAGRDLSSDQAVELAIEEAAWEPDRYQVRFVQQGIPPHPYWGVSLYDVGPAGRPTKVEVYLVDATTGEVTRQS